MSFSTLKSSEFNCLNQESLANSLQSTFKHNKTHKPSSSIMSIPSPPLSPYQLHERLYTPAASCSSAASSPALVENNRTNNYHDNLYCYTPAPFEDSDKESSIPTIAVAEDKNANNKRSASVVLEPETPQKKMKIDDALAPSSHTSDLCMNFKKNIQSFPIINHRGVSMVISPWAGFNKDPKGFKRTQFHILDLYVQQQGSKNNVWDRTGNNNKRVTRKATNRDKDCFDSNSKNSTNSFEGRTRSSKKDNAANSSGYDTPSENEKPIRRTPTKPTVHKPRSHTSTVNASSSNTGVAKVHDAAYGQLVDYSPATSTLANNKSLKTEWKGCPMDLSSDPLVNQLHPAEALLASTLRLPCDVYLDSKRRLFAEKVRKLKSGLPFRRTDAQKACRIDVNKASRLFASFEKVGWLKDGNFTKYL